MNPWKCVALVAWPLLMARGAQANDTDAKERAAKTACLSGDHAKGIALLSELYVSTNDPVFIFNQGRCFEQNRRYEDAIARFREYLRVDKRARAADKTDARKHISDCEDLLAKQAASSGERAGAGSGDDKIAKERAAKKACLTGDADGGVALLADLYVETNDANHIFNQGRCLEQVGRCEDAIIRFREYLRKTKDAGNISDGRAERHITECEEVLSKANNAQPTQTSSAPTPLAAAAKTSNQAEHSQGESALSAPVGAQSSAPPGHGLRVGGVAAFAVGVAGVTAGLGFALAANHLADELEASPPRYQPSKESTQASYATASAVSYVAGGVCVAGGALLYYLGWRQGRKSSAWIEPMLGPHTAGATAQVSF